MVERFKIGVSLVGKSAKLLRSDGSLIIFPFLSGISTLALIAILWGPALGFGVVDITTTESGDSLNAAGWVLIGISTYLATVVAVFFNVALAGCVARSLEGEDTKVSQGIAIARSRLGNILAWALIATVVSMIIRAIQERAGFLGAIIGAIGGVAWNLATLFVIPVLALEGLGPIAALKSSAQTFKARWGEGLTGNALIGLLTAAGVVVAFAMIVVGIIAFPAPALIAWAAFWIVAVMVFAAVMAAFNQVFNTALYIYSRDGKTSGPFTEAEFQAAFRAKK